MTIDEFFHSVGAYHGDSKNLSATTLRAFTALVRFRAAAFPVATDLFYTDRITQAFDDLCEEFGLPMDTDIEVVRIEEPEP